jgi:hypothetical protein
MRVHIELAGLSCVDLFGNPLILSEDLDDEGALLQAMSI